MTTNGDSMGLPPGSNKINLLAITPSQLTGLSEWGESFMGQFRVSGGNFGRFPYWGDFNWAMHYMTNEVRFLKTEYERDFFNIRMEFKCYELFKTVMV